MSADSDLERGPKMDDVRTAARREWRAELERAERDPGLADRVRRWDAAVLQRRFVAHYVELRALARAHRRRVLRRWGPTVGAAALLMALAGVPESRALALGANPVRTAARGGAQLLVVDLLTDEADGDYTKGDLSLREAIGLANQSDGADTVLFDPELFSSGPRTLALTLGELTITEDLIVDGPGQTALVLAAGEGARHFVIGGSGPLQVELDGLTLSGGGVSGTGGAILNGGDLKITAATISGNTADRGGGIYNEGGAVTLVDSTISGNSAAEDGGGVHSNGGTVTITGGALNGNTAAGQGGGIYTSNSLVITGSTISGNSATDRGGGIYTSGTLTITGSTISGNVAASGGGGIGGGAKATLELSQIQANSANLGGGLFLTGTGEVTLTRSGISGNSASLGGGVLGEAGSTLGLVQSIVSGNTASEGGGGGIYALGSTVQLLASTLVGNSASSQGAGLFAASESSVSLLNSTLSGNTANLGGGIYNQGGGVRLTNSTITGNTATLEAGGIANESGQLGLENTILAGNVAGPSPVVRREPVAGEAVRRIHSAGDLAGSSPDVVGQLSADHSLIGDVGSADVSGANNKIGGHGEPVLDPKLSPLRIVAFGRVHVPRPDSPAIDAGSDAIATKAGLTTDQVGNSRFTGTVDMGSVERQPPIHSDDFEDGTLDAWSRVEGPGED